MTYLDQFLDAPEMVGDLYGAGGSTTGGGDGMTPWRLCSLCAYDDLAL
jgi:hypothetical protein